MSKKQPTPEDISIIDSAIRLRKILGEFDWKLSAFSPGVIVTHHKDGRHLNEIHFSADVWDFIEPLLLELIKLRKEKAK